MEEEKKVEELKGGVPEQQFINSDIIDRNHKLEEENKQLKEMIEANKAPRKRFNRKRDLEQQEQ